MFERNRNAIGIDIGNHFLKLVSLEYSEKGIKLNKYIVEKLPNQLVLNGVIQQPEELGEIIKNLLIINNIKCNSISLSVTSEEESTVMKWTKIPNINNKELKKALNTIVEDELRCNPEDIYFNWTKLSEEKDTKQDVVEILMVGVQRTCMNNLVSCINKAKIKPYYAEADIFSILRSLFSENFLRTNELNLAVIDIGYNSSRIAIIEKNKFSYIRNIPVGGKLWINQISEMLGFDIKSSEEQLLINGCIYEDYLNLKEEQQAVSDVLSNPIEILSDEIRETIEFIQDFSKLSIDGIILTGGGSRLKGIETYMTNKIGIPCEIGTPYISTNLSIEKQEEMKEVWPSITTALGLALKEVGDNV